jgi:hypothetical protein
MAATLINDSVREFLAADTHPLLIDGERVRTADGRTFDTPESFSSSGTIPGEPLALATGRTGSDPDPM